jgi:hypothetical protein
LGTAALGGLRYDLVEHFTFLHFASTAFDAFSNVNGILDVFPTGIVRERI